MAVSIPRFGTSNAEMVWQEPRNVYLTVRGMNGDPASGATIARHDCERDPGPEVPDCRERERDPPRTNSAGVAAIVISPRTARFAAIARRGALVGSAVVKAALGEGEIQLGDPAEMQVRVVKQDRSPVSCCAELHAVTDKDDLCATAVPIAAGMCDVSGLLRLAGLPPGTFRLTLTGENARTSSEIVELRAGQCLDRGTIELADLRNIELLVIREDGSPVAGAAVHVEERSDRTALHQMQTDASGVVAIRDVPAAAILSIIVRADGFVAQQRVFRGFAEKPLRVQLKEGTLLQGQVVDDEGRPIGDARVTTTWQDPSSHAPLTDSVRSNASGGFTIPVEPSASTHVMCSKTGHSRQELTVTPTRRTGGSLSIECVLTGECDVAGRVTDETGEAVPSARVYFRRSRLDALVEASDEEVMSSSDGTFEISRRDPASAMLIARKQGFAPAIDELPSGYCDTEPRLNLRLHREAKLWLRREGRFSAAAKVEVIDGAGVRHALPLPDDDTVVDGLASGEAVVFVRSDSGIVVLSRRLALVSGETTSLSISAGPARLDGQVVMGGLPMPDAVVLCGPVHGDQASLRWTRTTASGKFDFELQEPGEYLVVAESSAGRAERRVTVFDGREEFLSLELVEAGVLVRVIDSRGLPIVGANVYAVPERQDVLCVGGFFVGTGAPGSHGVLFGDCGAAQAQTLSDGLARLTLSRPGRYRVDVRPASSEGASVTLDVPAGLLEVDVAVRGEEE